MNGITLDIRILILLVAAWFLSEVRGDSLVRSVRGGDHREGRKQIRGAEAPVISPASVHAANAQDAQRIKTGVWTARLRNRQVVPDTILRLGPKGAFYQPMMHPNGTFVVFWGREDRTTGSDIWSSAVDGSQCRRLTSDGRSEGPSWSPDAEAIFYSSGNGSSHPHIWRMDADGGNQRQLTDGPWSDSRPCVSPDGNTLVFVSNRSGSANLWRMEVSGREPVQVTRHEGTDFKPCISLDGRFLAYHTGEIKGSPHNVAVMRWPDGEPTFPVQLKPGEWLHGPFWTADGRRVLVHGYLMGVSLTRLYLVDVGSGQVELFPVPGFTRWGHGSFDRKETVMAFDGERS
ncbi:MAG: PD40 domain-containing protein [Phycisphaerae bacterium]|nr:PD40 domain-containing protein [Phycisphaerae bacterium]